MQQVINSLFKIIEQPQIKNGYLYLQTSLEKAGRLQEAEAMKALTNQRFKHVEISR